jgi:DNA-binding NarL/FixJ family response regulator
MIVDDHAAMRRVLITVASSSNIAPLEFIECESGEEAVRQYPIHRPDCVLMDIQLKEMSGFQAVEKIHDQDSHAKVVIVTSYDTLSVRSKADKLRVHGFVSKENLTDLHPYLQSIHQDPLFQ